MKQRQKTIAIDIASYLAAYGLDRLPPLSQPAVLTFNTHVYDRLRSRAPVITSTTQPAHGGNFFDWASPSSPARVFCSGDGGSAAAFTTEVLIARGVPYIIALAHVASFAGSSVVRSGDLFVPAAIISGDGTSRAYCPDRPHVSQYPDLAARARTILRAYGGSESAGLGYSVDSYFVPVPNDPKLWIDTSSQTLDMESAAFLAVCHHHNHPALLVQVVAAEIHDRQWVARQPDGNAALDRFAAALPTLLALHIFSAPQ